MIYEFLERFQFSDSLWLVIEYGKPIGSPTWTAFAYLDSQNASSIPLLKMQFEEIRTAMQFADMITTTRTAAKNEFFRWAGLVENRTSVRELL